jgi:hypothetical protein
MSEIVLDGAFLDPLTVEQWWSRLYDTEPPSIRVCVASKNEVYRFLFAWKDALGNEKGSKVFEEMRREHANWSFQFHGYCLKVGNGYLIVVDGDIPDHFDEIVEHEFRHISEMEAERRPQPVAVLAG